MAGSGHDVPGVAVSRQLRRDRETATLPATDEEGLTMGLGFGLLSAQLRPGETTWDRAYEETVAVAVEAERLGFSSVWTTEHHFVDDGYMPSLAVVSAAIAAGTSQIEIGTGVILAPLHHPIRLAEDAATVSLLSGGRFVLGLGLGWVDIEFRGLGQEMSKRGAAMEEILQILPQAFSGKPFRHRGPVYDLPEVAVRPTPSSSIPILIGGGAEPAVRRAARLADGIYANAPVPTFLRQIEWIRDECDKVGRDMSEMRIVHYSVMLPGSSPEEAAERYADHLWHMSWKYSDMEASATRPGPPPEAPPLDAERREQLLRRSVAAGTGDQIVEYLNGIREAAGVPVEFAARSYFPTVDYPQQIELMQQLAEEVAPHV
jgi:probable F420-dependent oxidoreductase